jgi:hypothetical protein
MGRERRRAEAEGSGDLLSPTHVFPSWGYLLQGIHADYK